MVIETKELLEKNNILFWLDEGTLLGAARKGELIKGDGDIDFAAWHNSLGQIIVVCKELEGRGYNIKYQRNLPYIEDLIQVYLPEDTEMTGIHVDFNIYKLKQDEAVRRDLHYPSGNIGKLLIRISRSLIKKNSHNNMMMLLFQKYIYRWKVSISYLIMEIYIASCKSIWQVVPRHMFDSFTELKLHGVVFNAPERYEEYLTYRYSKNWRVPDPTWYWLESGDMAVRYEKLNKVQIDKMKIGNIRYLRG